MGLGLWTVWPTPRVGSTVRDCDSTQVGPVARGEPGTRTLSYVCTHMRACVRRPPGSRGHLGPSPQHGKPAEAHRASVGPSPPSGRLALRAPAADTARPPSSKGRAGPGNWVRTRLGGVPTMPECTPREGRGFRSQHSLAQACTPVSARVCVCSYMCALPLQPTASTQGSGCSHPHRHPHHLAQGHL